MLSAVESMRMAELGPNDVIDARLEVAAKSKDLWGVFECCGRNRSIANQETSAKSVNC